MTNKDVFLQIISEVSKCSKVEAESLFQSIAPMLPASSKMNNELPDGESQKLLNELRQEKEGIRQWLKAGEEAMKEKEGHS